MTEETVNIGFELLNIKKKNKNEQYYNKESIEQMLKTAQRFMNYSDWKDTYHLLFEEGEGETV